MLFRSDLAEQVFNGINIPFHFILTIMICLVHSEKLVHHDIIQKLFDIIKERKEIFDDLKKTLLTILRNHRDRIELFGRYPERNKFLGRTSTEEEFVYLNAIYC